MTIQNVICDIDGVLMHDNVAVPGAAEFIKRILEKDMPLVMLTNYPSQTGQDLANRFATAGIDVPDSAFIPPRWPPLISCAARKARKPTWSVKAH
ncbi:protein nagD [Raoultella ornithinolytica]|nr:protein nagD [Raoultella ornithinolytica]